MSQKIDEFKEFVKKHPGLKDVVEKENKSWQKIYEEWTFYKDSDTWDKYAKEPISKKSSEDSQFKPTKEVTQLGDMVKTCINYVKKINPDNVTKTIGNIQKLMSLVAGIGAANTLGAANNNKLTGDPLFDKRFDEWY